MLFLRRLVIFAEKQTVLTSRCVAIRSTGINVKKEQRFFLSSETKNDPPTPPRRPLTAYLVFCKENRHIVLKEYPSLSATEQTKVLAEKWKSLNPTAREVYENIARDSVISYAQAHKKYYESLTEEQREALVQLKVKNKESRKNMRVKRMLKESGVPKTPSSAYTLFLQAEAKQKKISSLSEFNKEVAAAWHTLPDDKKQMYFNLAKKEKETYKTEMKAWREKLAKEGLQSLLQAYDESKLKAKGSLTDSLLKKRKKDD